MKQYIGIILGVFGIIFLLNTGCKKDSTEILPEVNVDTTYTDTMNVIGDTNVVIDPILGCTDEAATNFNAEATEDDGSCVYANDTIPGCTDPLADNYNTEANVDDESCEYPIRGEIGDFFNDIQPQSFFTTVNVDNYPIILCPQGTRILPNPNSLLSDGNPVSGNVTFEVIEIYEKGDMIRYASPTISNGYLLETGGEFFIRAFQNEVELTVNPGYGLTIQVPDYNATDAMGLFYGDENSPTFNWLESEGDMNIWLSEWEDSTGNQEFGFGYELLAENLGWINCDYFSGQDNLTNVTVDLVDKFTNANAVVFMVFNDLNSVVQLWGSPTGENFSVSNMPIGESVTFIVIGSLSEDPDNPEYEFALVEDVIVENHNEFIIPVPATLADIENALDGL